MSTLVKNIVRFILFILLQVYVLDNIHLHKLITPYLYMLFIIWLPFKMKRSWQLLIAFFYGFVLDSFRHTPGFHAAACVLIAYIRPFFINILIPQEGADSNYDEPSIKSIGGFTPYLIFVTALIFIHHAWLFLLEAWQIGDVWYFFGKTILSSGISLLLVVITELLFTRKQKFKTNTT